MLRSLNFKNENFVASLVK